MILAPDVDARRRGASLLVASCLCVGLAAAMGVRFAVAGGTRASSVPAAITFSIALLILSCAAGYRPSRPSLGGFVIGLGGGAALCAGPVLLRLTGAVALGAGPVEMLPTWAVAVTTVAVAEEVLLRGALFGALTAWRGDMVAVGVSAVVFALLHVPLYGAGALPLDVAAGVWLGGLRLAGRGITAPAMAHVIADLATWWLR
jgi:membrane protease YdiL (CAAX protease family)